jgi:R3H domain
MEVSTLDSRLITPSQVIVGNTTSRPAQVVPAREGESAVSQNDRMNQKATTSTATANDSAVALQRKRRPRKKKNTNRDAHASPSLNEGQTLPNERLTLPIPTNTPKQREPRKPKGNRKYDKKRNNNVQHLWWRKQVPPDAVDPITLDPLDDLQYPPFALVGMPPYAPVDWPPDQSAKQDESPAKDSLSEEQRQRQILEQQWGRLTTKDNGQLPANGASLTEAKNRRVNLFDGRALAYYMVSQLQFIDPLNRRDLVRDELVHLDQYLRRHGFVDINVTEAYDAKGVTISTAGAAATTATGRATILQQEARVLLNALFGHQVANSANTSQATSNPAMAVGNQNSLRRQYEAHQSSQVQRHRSRPPSRARAQDAESRGVYGESGLIIIDDDENPGLRGNAPEFVPSPNGLYSASHIVNRHGQSTNVQEQEFPTLAPAAGVQEPPSNNSDNEIQTKKVLPKAKTLTKIGKLVKKTNPEEQQRQWEAREEARRKAELSSITFTNSRVGESDGLLFAAPAPSETVIDRNRAFAEALGVKPATVRTPVRTGWTRPSEGAVQMDEFGNELNSIAYPETLVKQAREIRLDVLLKLEKKWKSFLADDSAASIPLNPMERALRSFVHEYGVYWKLHTESFDPEPKRYIHCVKLRDTSAPYPLITDVLQNGNRFNRTTSAVSLDHPAQQTAGQPTWATREIPTASYRVPLTLKPRSNVVGQTISSQTGVSLSGAPSRSMMESETINNSRFSVLADGRERPKLELQKRTLPTELPPFEPPGQGFDISEELERQRERREAKARKEQQDAELKQRALAAAFDSDDEDSNKHRSVQKSNMEDSESEWEEQQAVYAGSDEES